MGNDSSKNQGTAKKGVISSIKSNVGGSKTTTNVNNRLATGGKTHILNLQNLSLKAIPDERIEKPELLKHLDASKNLLKSVPITISKFTNMKQLILNQNAITEIPEEIGLCKNLVQLELSENLLIDLPMNIKMLEKLTTIVLSKNAFQAYPIALCLLQHLDVANLSDNQITELPADIGNSSCIEINLDNNKLEKLNDNIANCKRLKVLRLNHNCLTVEVFTKQLMENSPVCKIYFEGNYFEEKQFQQLPGYNQYEQRYTANVNKVN